MRKALRFALALAALVLMLSTTVQGSEIEPSPATGQGGYCTSFGSCCLFTMQNCSVQECYCDQLCHWYGDCCDNITATCASVNNTVVIGNGTRAEILNTVLVVMNDQDKVLRRLQTFRNIIAQVIRDSCVQFQCTSYSSGSLGDAVVVTAGYDVIITTVSRNSSNISEVAFYVSANNGSVVMDARDVMEALKENSSAPLKAQFVVYDIIVASPSVDSTTSQATEPIIPSSPAESLTPSSSIEVSSVQMSSSITESISSSSLETPSTQALSSITESSIPLSSLEISSSTQPSSSITGPISSSSSLEISTSAQPSFSVTGSPSGFSLTPSPPTASSPLLSPSPSPSRATPTAGSPTAAPASDELGSQVIGLIVGGAVGGALIAVVLLALFIARCVRSVRTKEQDTYREMSFTAYPDYEEEDVEVKPRKKGKLVMEYEKLE